MNKQYLKIGVLVAGVLMIVSTLLPYVSVFGFSISLLLADGSTVADGIFFVILAALCIVFALMDKAIPMLAASAAAVILWIYEMSQMSQFGALVSKGAGYYLLAVSAIALLVLSILCLLTGRKGGDTPEA